MPEQFLSGLNFNFNTEYGVNEPKNKLYFTVFPIESLEFATSNVILH